MAKLVYIVRHGIAVDHGEPGMPDPDRPLTEKGRERTRQIAVGLKKLGVSFAVTYTSPWLRARQTADILAREMGAGEPTIAQAMIPSSPLFEMATVIQSARVESLACVGHDPHVSFLTGFLMSGTERMGVEFTKGGVACLEVPDRFKPGGAVLKWLLTSRHLRKIGGY